MISSFEKKPEKNGIPINAAVEISHVTVVIGIFLAVPIAANTRRRPEPRPAEPANDLPDLMISVPPPQPVDTIPLAPDSVVAKPDSTAEPKKDDPLGPIFQNR